MKAKFIILSYHMWPFIKEISGLRLIDSFNCREKSG